MLRGGLRQKRRIGPDNFHGIRLRNRADSTLPSATMLSGISPYETWGSSPRIPPCRLGEAPVTTTRGLPDAHGLLLRLNHRQTWGGVFFARFHPRANP